MVPDRINVVQNLDTPCGTAAEQEPLRLLQLMMDLLSMVHQHQVDCKQAHESSLEGDYEKASCHS